MSPFSAAVPAAGRDLGFLAGPVSWSARVVFGCDSSPGAGTPFAVATRRFGPATLLSHRSSSRGIFIRGPVIYMHRQPLSGKNM